MGYVHCTGPCIFCKEIFDFNPHRVPSTSAVTGKREPVCSECMTLLNEKRVANGMPPFEIDPNAYKAIPEESL